MITSFSFLISFLILLFYAIIFEITSIGLGSFCPKFFFYHVVNKFSHFSNFYIWNP